MLLPASILRRVYEPFLRKIPAADAWGATLRAAAGRGAVIHVVRNVSLLDLMALKHLSARFGLPEIGFANDFEEVLSTPPTKGLFGSREEPAVRLRRAVLSGKSAVLFLKRAPGVIERASTAHRGKTEGDALLSELIDIARTGPREVLLVPETLVWTMRPERLGFSLHDFLFSPAEFPGEVRALGQLTANHEHVVIRAGEPLVLRDLVANESSADPRIIRRLVYALLRKVERERKSVVGPAQKPPDRVREEVLKSPRLGGVMRDLAHGDEAKHRLVTEKAREMLRGLSAEPDPSTLRVLETMADTVAERVFSGIDVDLEGIERVREASRRGSVVLLPSHKSHVDYLLLHYVLRKHALSVPLVAAGDNLSFFPLGPLLRRSGAFFIRRSFRGDKLYAVVVDAYIRRLLRDGYAIELFVEGGRSRTGKLLPPQVGLLNMVVEAALGLDGRPVSFVPVSIGYERMMEETEFLRELSGGTKKREDIRSLLSAGRALLGSYGRPNVQFGRVLDLGALKRTLSIPDDPTPAKRRSLVNSLAQTVMDEINRVTAVTPGALVATVLLCHPRRGMSHTELLLRARRLLVLVREAGARLTPKLTEPGGELSEAAIREAAEVYVRGGLLRRHVPGDTLTRVREKRDVPGAEEEVIWVVPEERRIALDIPKNMIVHLFVDRALVAIALGAHESRPPAAAAPAEQARSLPDATPPLPEQARSLPDATPPLPEQALSPTDPTRPLPDSIRGAALLAHDPSAAAVLERARFLARLFRFELNLRADATFDARFAATLDSMERAGEIARSPDGAITPGPGHDGLDGRGWLLFYAAVLRNFLEGYRVAARSLRTLVPGPADPKDLVARALRIGEQMFLGGEIERAEAVSRPLIENALQAFRDLGYVLRDAESITLTDAHRTPAGAAALESRITPYLTRPAFDTGF